MSNVITLSSIEEDSFQGNDLDQMLQRATWLCIKRMKLIFRNCFFTLANRDLIILNSFININSKKSIHGAILKTGVDLKDPKFKNNALNIAHRNNSLGYASYFEQMQNISTKLYSVASPIRLKGNTLGYISFSSTSHLNFEIITIFLESLVINIESNYVLLQVKTILNKHMNAVSKSKGRVCLSDREKYIADCIMYSVPNRQIADDFYISETTVKTYLKRIYNKCGTTNKVETAVFLLCSELMNI